MATETIPHEQRYYSLEEAQACVPRLRELFGTIMGLRSQLKSLYQRLEAAGHPPSEQAAPRSPASLPPEVTRDRMVFHGMSETLREHVERVLATGCVIKDIETGLVDWLSMHDGREVWLCWKYPETAIGWWHDLQAGFAGRQPIAELRPTLPRPS
jgi:hypothetical protein